MSQRYQKEIEEILEQANMEAGEGKDSGRTRTQQNSRPKQPSTPKPGRTFRFTTGKVLLAGVVLLLLSPIIGAVGGPMEPFAWLGIGLIIASYVIYFTKPRRPIERRWRGQLIEDEAEPNALQRLWRWLTRT